MKQTIINYRKNRQCTYPAPFVTVKLSSPVDLDLGDKVCDIDGLIDSGADITVMPEKYLEYIGVPITGYESITFGDGSTESQPLFYVNIEMAGESHDLQVTLWEKDFALLGRDILNKYVIELNGPEDICTLFTSEN
jgi:Retroviral aspartyl protease